MSHYFTTDHTLKHQHQTLELNICDIHLSLTTDRGVFSRHVIDFGSRVLIENVALNGFKKVLDMGCGYGPIGLFIARSKKDADIILADINERAIDLTRENIKRNNISNAQVIKSDLFNQIDESFDLIVTNPPIRAGKHIVFGIYEGAYHHLNDGGSLYVVIQKKQGAPSSVKKLEALFGSCKIVTKKNGYWILLAKKLKSD